MKEQRRFRRILFREALGFGTGSSDELNGTTAYDLSSGGVRIRSEQFMSLGTPIRLRLQLAENEVVDMTGKVVWVQKEPFGEYYQLGVEFEENVQNMFRRRSIEDYIEDGS